MVQMSRKSVQKPKGSWCGCCGTCFLLLCNLVLFGTVVLVTTYISDDNGTKNRFHVPWMKPNGKNDNTSNHNFFPRAVSLFGKGKKKKRRTKPSPFNKDRTMTLKKQDYSNIGGPQVIDSKSSKPSWVPKHESKPTVVVKNFALEPPTAKEEEKKEAFETPDPIKKKKKPDEKKKSKPSKKGEKKSEDLTETKPKEDKAEANKKKKKAKKSSGRTDKSEVKKGANSATKKEEKGSIEPKKSKKAAPSEMEGKDLVSAGQVVAKNAKKSSGDVKRSKNAKKSSGDAKLSKNAKKSSGDNPTEKTMSGATKKKDDVKPKETSGAANNKKGTKKVGEKKMSEGVEGAKAATKS